jgi:curved DNA-binding protein CbpA
MSDDYYSILGVHRTATAAEIKARYRFLCHAYHPDKFGSDAHRQTAEEEFKRINGAYQILSNPSQRADYDASSFQSTPPPRQQSQPPPRYEPPPQQKQKYNHSPPPRETPPPRPQPSQLLPPVTESLAKWSLGLGIAGLLCGIFTSIPAVICGHRALAAIENSNGRLIGRGFAKTGLVLGYLIIGVMVLSLCASLFSK